RVLLRLLTKALEARSGPLVGKLSATGSDGGTTVRLVPSEHGSTVRTSRGNLHLPGLRLALLAGKGNRSPPDTHPPRAGTPPTCAPTHRPYAESSPAT